MFRKLNNLKLTVKILGGMFIIFSLSVLLTVFGLMNGNSLEKQTEQLVDVEFKKVELIQKVIIQIVDSKSHIVNFMQEAEADSKRQGVIQQIELTNQMSWGIIKEYQDVGGTEDELYPEMEKNLLAYEQSKLSLVEAVTSGAPESEIKKITKSYNDNREASLNYMYQQLDILANKIELIKTENYKDNLRMFIIMVSGLFFMIVAALIITIFIYKNINSRIGRLNEMTANIGNGDLTGQVNAEFTDEIGQIEKSINLLTTKMNELLYGVATNSENVTSEYEEIMATLTEVSEHTNNIAESMEESLDNTKLLETSTVAVVLDTKNIELATKSLESKAAESDEKAIEIKERAKEVKVKATLSQERAINIYEEKLKNLNSVQELAKVVNEVGLLADTIADIASQTNLLSLNASIESARAGEAGRGFAVVAEEVRRLSDQSNKSADNIRKVIENVRGAFDEMSKVSMDLIQFIDTDVRQDYKFLVEIGEAYQKDADFVATMSNEIMVSSKEISQIITQISKTLVDLQKIAVENETTSGEINGRLSQTAAAIEELTVVMNAQNKSIENVNKLSQYFKFKYDDISK